MSARPQMPPVDTLLSSSIETDAEASNQRILDKSIGEIIRASKHLSDSQIDSIREYQKRNRMRFGEAAVALRLATNDDVLWALSQQFHYPYIANVNDVNPELVVASRPFTDEAETFRELRSQLMMGVLAPVTGEPRRAIAVMSPDIGDGKSYLAANLAVSFSQLGGRTLLIDGDMRTPRLHELFDIGEVQGGLSTILSGRSEVPAIRQLDNLPSLYLLPVGAVPPNPLELLQRSSFGLLMIELINKFDYVVVDTPASVHGADARVIAARCGAAVVMGRRDRSALDALNRLVASIGKSSCKLAGVIYNEH